MSPSVARKSFLLILLVSVPCALYPFWVTFTLYQGVANKADSISFDSASYYLLLASVFWPMALLECCGRNPDLKCIASICSRVRRHAGAIIMGWFVACLIFGTIGMWVAPVLLEGRGYTACENANSISRVSKGESLIFVLGSCTDMVEK